jgi:hypothetical protein
LVGLTNRFRFDPGTPGVSSPHRRFLKKKGSDAASIEHDRPPAEPERTDALGISAAC